MNLGRVLCLSTNTSGRHQQVSKSEQTTVNGTHLDCGLHYDTRGIIHTFRAELQHSRVALFFGLRQVLVDVLQGKALLLDESVARGRL